MSHERSLAEPAFPGDDGAIDDALSEILHDPDEVLAVLGHARIFVPVVAVLTSDKELAAVEGDKGAEMATVLMRGADGRQALLAFTSVAAMQSWNATSRPVPVYGRDAARAALAERASAMLIDLGSANFQVIETEDLEHVAAEHVMVRTPSGTAWLTSTPTE